MDYYPRSGGVLDFAKIAEDGWENLLLGNGMSINLSPDFAYETLREEADVARDLERPEREIFELFRTTNFEVVLAKLQDTIALAAVVGERARPYLERFLRVQEALGSTVREVHPKWVDIPEETLESLRTTFEGYRRIFTTNYDLLLYWAVVSNNEQFRDCFWANGRNEFDPARCKIGPDHTATYYLHGALHLVAEGSGTTRKLTREKGQLLDQFGKPDEDDPEARPLLVAEGSSFSKLQAIEGNPYLSHVYSTFKKERGSLLVFGQSLRGQDHHLIDAINANPHRRVAISMHWKNEAELEHRRHKILSKLRVDEVYFFDAATHPLGNPDLRIPEGSEIDGI